MGDQSLHLKSHWWLTQSTYLPQQTKQHVRVKRSFVSLVHDNRAVVIQVGLSQRLPQQDTISHVLYQRFLQRSRKSMTLTYWLTTDADWLQILTHYRYWLTADIDSLQVLTHYTDTDLPQVLTHYRLTTNTDSLQILTTGTNSPQHAQIHVHYTKKVKDIKYP